jgi:hypothetical protein
MLVSVRKAGAGKEQKKALRWRAMNTESESNFATRMGGIFASGWPWPHTARR